jgi:hypothetical protein
MGGIINMKTFFLLVFVVHFVFPGESLSENWPDEIYNDIILAYAKDHSNFDITKKEYNYVLDYLERLIIAHKDNIENYFSNKSITQWTPAYVNEELIIIEIEKTNLIWDEEIAAYAPRASIDIIGETVAILSICYDYNLLINFWYNKTNMMLRDEYDVDKVWDELYTDIKLRNNGSIEFYDEAP